MKSPSIRAGSASAAIVMSRLAPMPPKGLPVSSAAVARAKRPRARVAHQQQDAARGFQGCCGQIGARGGPCRVAERRRRDQTARVDGVDGDVRPNRRVDRGAKLRLVVGAVQPQAAREKDQRFLLRQRPKHGHGRLKGRQLAIGVEDVEFTFVLTKCGSRQRIGNAVPVRIVAKDQRLDDLTQQRAVAR